MQLSRSRQIALAVTFLLPMLAQAHNLRLENRPPPAGVADRGELLYQQDKFSYRAWNSAQLPGKVRVIQHIAGRSSAKEKNAALIEAIKAEKLPHDRYQITTIVNTDDAIPGTGMFVRNSIESNKKQYPLSQFIVDSDGRVKSARQLDGASSAIAVLDKTGHVRFVKDGALTRQEVQQVMALLKQLLE